MLFSAISSSINTPMSLRLTSRKRRTIFLLMSFSIFSRLDSIFLILSSVIITLIYSPFFHMRGRYKNLPQRFYDGCHFWQQIYFLHLMQRTAILHSNIACEKYHYSSISSVSPTSGPSPYSLAHLFESG